MSAQKVVSILAEFGNVVDGVYGMFLDARKGFQYVQKSIIQLEKESKNDFSKLQTERPDLGHLEHGGIEFSYGRFVPAGSPPRHRHMHQKPSKVILQRNENLGSNNRFLGNICLVMLYQYWEDRYRKRLADALGVSKNQIKVELFGTIGAYRHAIIHNGGYATDSVENSKLFRWYKKDDQVFFDQTKFEEVVDAIFEFLQTAEKHPEQFIKRQ